MAGHDRENLLDVVEKKYDNRPNEAHDARFIRSIDRFLKCLPRYTAVVCCNYVIYRMARQVLEKQAEL